MDLADIAAVDVPVHARIRVSGGALGRKHAALACHRSQLGGGGPVRRVLWLAARCLTAEDLYMRAHPKPVAGSSAEVDLFEGIR